MPSSDARMYSKSSIRCTPQEDVLALHEQDARVLRVQNKEAERVEERPHTALTKLSADREVPAGKRLLGPQRGREERLDGTMDAPVVGMVRRVHHVAIHRPSSPRRQALSLLLGHRPLLH